MCAYHTVGPGITTLTSGFRLDDLWGHPGVRSCQRHLSGAAEKPGRAKIADLTGELIRYHHYNLQHQISQINDTYSSNGMH